MSLFARAAVPAVVELARVLRLESVRPVTLSDRELVLRARAGDAVASEQLFRRHHQLIRGMVHRLLPFDRELDDIVQDCFMDAFEKLDRLLEPDAFRGWLRGIAIGRARNRLRRRRLMRTLGLGGHENFDPESMLGNGVSPERGAELLAIYRVLRSLPPDTRLALVLHRVEGFAVREVAEQTGMSMSTVKRRLAAAEAKLGAGYPGSANRESEPR